MSRALHHSSTGSDEAAALCLELQLASDTTQVGINITDIIAAMLPSLLPSRSACDFYLSNFNPKLPPSKNYTSVYPPFPNALSTLQAASAPQLSFAPAQWIRQRIPKYPLCLELGEERERPHIHGSSLGVVVFSGRKAMKTACFIPTNLHAWGFGCPESQPLPKGK